jgi:hypothetical protein
MRAALFSLASCLAYSVTLKMEAIHGPEMSGFLQTTWCYNPEDRTFDTMMFLLLFDL